MPGLEVQPFSDEHLGSAAELLAQRHRRHREAEPLLSEPADYRAEIEALWQGDDTSGAVALRDGRTVGYVLGIRKSDGIWGPNVWVDPAGHAVEEPDDVRDLYAAAAERWMDEGRHRHYVTAPASDDGLLASWARLSFGRQHSYAVREVPPADMPESVRVAEERDIEELVELGPMLEEHQARAPVFSSIEPDSEEEMREELLKELVNHEVGTLVAEADGRIVGSFFLAPVEHSTSHSSLARVEGSLLLAWAVTRPDVRGSGAGVALTQGSFAWARDRGYDVMVTDWRETNLLSSRFWPRRGFRETFVRLYRSIP